MTTVFETIRTYNGKPFKLKEHVERLKKSAEIVGLNADFEEIDLGEVEAESRIRLILSEDGFQVTSELLEEKPDTFYQEGVKAISYSGKRKIPLAKVYEDPFLKAANEAAKKAGVYEAILVDDDGFVREGSYSNIFWVKEGQVFTTKSDVLEGITRETVEELVDVKHENIKLEDLLLADEIFITQTTSGILPVVQIDDRVIGGGTAGKITSKLIDKFNQLVWK